MLGGTIFTTHKRISIDELAAAFRRTLAEMRAEGDRRFEAVEHDGTRILLHLRPEPGQPAYTMTLELAAFAELKQRPPRVSD